MTSRGKPRRADHHEPRPTSPARSRKSRTGQQRSWLLAVLFTLLANAMAQGKLSFEPISGPIGTVVTATATGLTPNSSVALEWGSAEAAWNVTESTFHGVLSSEVRTTLANATADTNGNATLTFAVPEDYGYMHNVFLTSAGEETARQGFVVVPTFTISPSSGPVGTPITVTMTGVGYRFWEMVWHLLYDGAQSGWLSGITTKGNATAVIPATGAAGFHTLQVMSGTIPVPYLNLEQSPSYIPGVPIVMSALFEITAEPPVWPEDTQAQELARAPGEPSGGAGPALNGDYASGTVGSAMRLSGSGFPATTELAISYTTTVGNRLSGKGWDEQEQPLGTVTTDADGAFTYSLTTPDSLGGPHRFIATAPDATTAEFVYTITPSVSFWPEGPVAPGGDITVTIKGVGWTETANIYTLLLDNGYIGYGCGFNSQGDVTVRLKAPGQSGMHFISLYPAIYQGEITGPGAPPSSASANAGYFQLPMLHYQDHPGEELPAFHLAFEVR